MKMNSAKEESNINPKEAIKSLSEKVKLKGIQRQRDMGAYSALLRLSTVIQIWQNRMDSFGWVPDAVCANELLSLLDMIYILECLHVITSDEASEWENLCLLSGRIKDNTMEDTTDIENE